MQANYGRIRSFIRWSLVLAVLIGFVPVTMYLWDMHLENERAKRIGESWGKILDEEAEELSSIRRASIDPLNEYFDEIAIPNIENLLSDFSGPIDTSAYVWKWITDKIEVRSRSDRVSEAVKASLNRHMGFPDAYSTSIKGSIQRFQMLLRQRDARLRERTYEFLQGEGVNIDKDELAQMFAEAERVAFAASFESAMQESTVDFAGEQSVAAISILIGERVMVVIATRMGIISMGGKAAVGTAGAGTATGVGALPSWGIAVAEIVITIVIDMIVSRWLVAEATDTMTDNLNDARIETARQLGIYMGRFEFNLRKQRELMVQKAIR